MKDLLENYMNYKADIKAKEHTIIRLESEEIGINGSNFAVNGDIRPKGYMNSNIENKVINNADKINKLKAEIEVLKSKIDMIDSLINTLNDYYREIARLKYMYNKNDNQIAYIMKRDERTIRYAIKKVINDLEIKYMDFLNIS